MNRKLGFSGTDSFGPEQDITRSDPVITKTISNLKVFILRVF
jgi:hypothetical protein